jgi:hypothetical protein
MSVNNTGGPGGPFDASSFGKPTVSGAQPAAAAKKQGKLTKEEKAELLAELKGKDTRPSQGTAAAVAARMGVTKTSTKDLIGLALGNLNSPVAKRTREALEEFTAGFDPEDADLFEALAELSRHETV